MKKYNKIIKTNVNDYDLTNPYERYSLKLSLARDILNYVNELSVNNSKEQIDTVKRLTKKSKYHGTR